MKIIKEVLKDIFLIKNDFQKDNRGKFIKFNNNIILKNKKINFDQFCYSINKKKFTLRGLHYQKKPFQEEKLITCVKGTILDVVLDINPNSKYYLRYKFINLSDKYMYSLYVGKNYAHGFLTLTNDATILYQIKGKYIKTKQCGYLWNDPKLKIKWPTNPKIISLKDKKFKTI